jgi:Tol biopolymer transport system component
MTADGRAIVLPIMNSSRQIWDVSEGRPEQAVQISGGTEKHFESIAWSRNEFLVFDEDGGSSFDKYNIYRARMDGSDLQQLTDEAGSNTDPTVSPDGATIVFISNRTGKRQLWKMSIDGRDVSQLTDLTNDVIRPVFSPDGQTIFFSVSVAGKCQIWRVPAGGGMPSPVIDADVYRWTVSPVGTHLAYSTFDRDAFMVRTHIHSLQLDQPDLVLDISPETWMEWSNDGKSIYYNVADDGSQNIWRQHWTGPNHIRRLSLTESRYFALRGRRTERIWPASGTHRPSTR